MVNAKDFGNGHAGRPATRPRPTAPAAETVHPAHPADGGTDPKTPGESLERAVQFNQALLNIITDLLFEVRKDGLILSFRAPKDNEFQLTAEVVVGRRIMDSLPPHLGQLAMHYLEKTLRTGQPQHFSCQHQLPGRVRDFEARLSVTSGGHALVLVRDVTDRETLEKEVVESSNRVQMRLGQDIHDGLGQHLTAITFLSRSLEKTLAAKNIPEATEAAEISKLVMEALSQTRNLARGLFPVEIEPTDLVLSLGELAKTVEELFNISCTVECDESADVHDQAAATHLFRLAQEAINNAVKHGKARRVVITLRVEGDHRVLRIADDGVGLPPEGALRTGLGLRIMRYRAQKVAGKLEFHAGETGGTTVTCSFNLNHDEN